MDSHRVASQTSFVCPATRISLLSVPKSKEFRMRIRIRIVLLTVALVAGLNSSAQAGADCLLNPFHWLFGCGYGCDGGCGYGYDSRMATYRIIDDWLGYGYLRNQEGTLGHYPGRPFGGYRPAFHGLFHPCPQPAPALAMPAPIPAPMPAPMAPLYNPCWDPCQNSCSDPCGDPCAMAPMPSMPVPVTTWRPMTVMVPQTQWVNVPQMPMGYPASDCGGCDSCGGGAIMPSPGIVPGPMMQGAMLPGMNHVTADSGCGCGGGGMMTQPSAGIPQTTYYSPSSFNGYGMNSYGQYPGYNTAMMPAATAWHPHGHDTRNREKGLLPTTQRADENGVRSSSFKETGWPPPRTHSSKPARNRRSISC